MPLMRFRKTETTPEKSEDSALQRRFERKVRLSWLALQADRIWEALPWPFLVAALFLVVSLLELWSFMPPLLHRAVLGAFGIGLLVSFLPLVRIHVPTRLEALRRLAVDGDKLVIGACVRHAAFHKPVVPGPLGLLLSKVVRHIAHYPIRPSGTF